MLTKMKLKNILIFLSVLGIAMAKKQFLIGGMFHDDNLDAEIAFKTAIDRENMSHNKNFEFVPVIRRVVDPMDTYQAEKIACALASEGVIAIFGPSSTYTSNAVGSVCQELGIPHIIVHWMPEDFVPNSENHMYTRSVFPESNLFATALKHIIVDYQWNGFTLIYENNESLVRLQEILQIHGPGDNPVTVRQLGPGDDYQPLLKEIEVSGVNHIILDCSPAKIMNILKQAVGVKMMEEYQSYLITSLDAHTLDFAELKFVRANITTLRLMSPTSFEVGNAVHEWRQEEIKQYGIYRTHADKIRTEAALYHDAVKTFGTALREFHATQEIVQRPLRCTSFNKWEQGLEFIQYMDSKTVEGMTGRIVFDNQGRRDNFYMEILELNKDGFIKIATWDAIAGINYTRSQTEVDSQVIQSLQNKTIIVAARLGKPYLELKPKVEGEYWEGNDRFVGYSIDLIDGIAKIIGFHYKFELVQDNRYGSFNKVTKKWDGLVKQLLDRKADLAICDLTITYERRTAVDFTIPFMTLGISILFAKPVKEPPSLFSFLSPLSTEVWLYMATAYLCISVLLFFLAKMSADDWENPHPCDDNPEELETIWNMHNCIWLTAGSIMQQGCDLLPKAISTRLAAGLWWFFALIVISSYTANLAAFLTKEGMDVKIGNAEDLAKQSKIKYGVMLGGSTLSFFKESNFSTYQRMWASMESAEPTVFTKNNDEGVERVAKGDRKYAFIMESTSIEYIVNRNCNLTQVGGLLDSKGHGIAMPVNSPYRTYINQAVLKMQEEGKLQRLKDKWWKDNSDGGGCDDNTQSTDGPSKLNIKNVGGVFLVLLIGCSFAFFIGIMEFLWNVRKVAIDTKTTPWEAFKKEFVFAMDVRITTKPNMVSENSVSHNSGSSLRSKSIELNDDGSFKHMNNV